MSASSAARAQTITVRVDEGGDPWINVKGTISGCWEPEAIEALIQELAEAIGKVATLEDRPEPLPTLADIPVGTAFRFNGDFVTEAPVYIKLTGDRLWSTMTERINRTWPSDLSREVVIEEAQDD